MDWTEKELEDHWYRWCAAVYRSGDFDWELDFQIDEFKNMRQLGPMLRRMRLSSPFRAADLAVRLGIRPSAYLRFERREENGAISLANLSRCAAAMDCEVIYVIRPKGGVVPSRRMFNAIAPKISRSRRPLFLLAALKYRCPKFRREMGWIRNRVKPQLY